MRLPLRQFFLLFYLVSLLPARAVGASDSLEVARIYGITREIVFKSGDVAVDSLHFYSKKGIELARKNNLLEYIADFYTNIGYAYKRTGDFDKAAYYSSLAYYEAIAQRYIRGIARGGYNHAIICFDKGDIPRSFEQISQNLEFARTHRLDYYLFVNYYLLSHINSYTNNPLITEYYMEKAFQYHSDSSVVEAFKMKNRLAKAIYEGKTEEQEKLFKQFRSRILKNDTDPRTEEFRLLIEIANTYTRAGYAEKALRLFEELAGTESNDVEYPEIMIKANLATTYLKANMYREAERVNPVADRSVRRLYNYNNYLTILKNDAFIKAHKGQEREALTLWNEIYTLEDSLSHIRNQIGYLLVTHLKNLESQEDKLLAINQQNTQQRILLEKERKQKVLLLVLVILLITLCGVIYNLFRRLSLSNGKILQQNKAISAQTESLRKSNFMKDKLFSLMSHELRSPVAELITILDVNEWKNKDSTLYPYLKSVNRKAKTIYTTLDNILIWSSSHLKSEKTEMKPIDIRDAVEAALGLNQEEIVQKNIRLENILSPVLVLGNINYLMIILRNILNNAVKFTPVNGVIRLSNADEEEYSGVMVEDSGAGMPPEKLQSLFVTVQDSTEGTYGEKGSGVGLVLCKDLVDKLQGKIEISSVMHEGTSVKLLFRKVQSNVLK